MTLVEKVEKVLSNLRMSTEDKYFVDIDFLMEFAEDKDSFVIFQKVAGIVQMLNSASTEEVAKLFDTEVSDLMEMVK